MVRQEKINAFGIDNRIETKLQPTLGFMQVGLDSITSAICKSQL